MATPPSKTPARCWYCNRHVSAADVERDGILRSRRAVAGGPYRILICPECGRDNLCEKTRRGRWFASPNLRISVFEYFFSQMLDTRPEDFLAAATWIRENEERRRYFFERDGDRRYSSSWLGRLWRQAPGEPERAAPAGRERREETDKSRARTTGSGRTSDDETERTKRGAGDSPPRPPGRPGVLSPHEILGVPLEATERQIRAAFRRLATQYHPDKVHHLGEEFQRAAHEKFLALKTAYETMTARGD